MGLVLIGFGEQPNTKEWEELSSFKKTDQSFIKGNHPWSIFLLWLIDCNKLQIYTFSLLTLGCGIVKE